MTPDEEDAEIIRNAREKYQNYLKGLADGITREQLYDVYRLIGDAVAEREMKWTH